MEIWRHHLNRGAAHLRHRRYAEAAREFERAHAVAPEEPRVLLGLGRERMRQERFAEAEPLLLAAREALPRSGAAAATLARLLGLHFGKLDQAHELLQCGLEVCPSRPQLYVVQGELLLEEGAFVAARAAFTRALDDPETEATARKGLARAHNAEGITHAELGRLEQALFAFKRAAALDPKWSSPLVNQGVALGRLDREEKALEAYAQALERNPANPVAYFNLGTALCELRRLDEAVQTLEILLEVVPDYPGVREVLANVLGEQKRFDPAIALLLEELECHPNSASCWSSLGLAYVCSGNAERGEECLLRALELDPTYLNATRNLASLYLSQGRVDELKPLLERTVQPPSPHHPEFLGKGH